MDYAAGTKQRWSRLNPRSPVALAIDELQPIDLAFHLSKLQGSVRANQTAESPSNPRRTSRPLGRCRPSPSWDCPGFDTAGEWAGSRWRRHESDEGGFPGLCGLVVCDPIRDAAEVDRSRRENLLKVGLGRTDVAATP